MQVLRKCTQGFTSAVAILSKQPFNIPLTNRLLPAATIHSSVSWFERNHEAPKKFTNYNKIVYPVQGPDEERRPAFVCHMKANIKYSQKTMWYIACLVRGMTVDEAVKQLSFVLKKGAAAVKETILEAQKMAVEEHNVEFKSNLWVAESFSTKGVVIKGVRRHARGRAGEVRYGYVHYFVRLEEGKPPEDYYLRRPKTQDEHLESWMAQMRQRKIYNSL